MLDLAVELLALTARRNVDSDCIAAPLTGHGSCPEPIDICWIVDLLQPQGVRSTLRDTGHIHGEQRWRLDVGLVAVARDVGYLLFETVEEAFARRAVTTALMPRRTLHRRWSR